MHIRNSHHVLTLKIALIADGRYADRKRSKICGSDQGTFLQALSFVEICHKRSKFLVTHSSLNILGYAFSAKVEGVGSKIFLGGKAQGILYFSEQTGFYKSYLKNNSSVPTIRAPNNCLKVTKVRPKEIFSQPRPLLKPIYTCTQMVLPSDIL